MPLKVLIKDASVTTSQINGKSGTFESRSQVGWVELPSGETRKLRVRVSKGAMPYSVGAYIVGDDSFTVSQYGDLQIGALTLLPEKKAA